MQRREEAVTIDLDESIPSKAGTSDINGHIPRSGNYRLTAWIALLGLTRFVLHIAAFSFYLRAIWVDWTHYSPVLIDYELVDEQILVFFQGSIFYKVCYISNICEVSLLIVT